MDVHSVTLETALSESQWTYYLPESRNETSPGLHLLKNSTLDKEGAPWRKCITWLLRNFGRAMEGIFLHPWLLRAGSRLKYKTIPREKFTLLKLFTYSLRSFHAASVFSEASFP